MEYFAPGDASVSLTASADGSVLAVQGAAAAAVFVQVASPVEGRLTVHAIRSDGKVLPAQNCWLSRSRSASPGSQYLINLFDTDMAAGQTYALTYSTPVPENRAPSLTIVGGRTFHVATGGTLYIDVSAQDPDGTIPLLSTALLPDGARFTDRKNGRGYLSWTPAAGLEGRYAIQFKATDGALSDIESAAVVVSAATGAGFSGWCEQFWPGVADPAIVGSAADPDGDGIVNVMEYALGSDPTYSDESLLPWLGLETVDGKRYLTLTYWRRTQATDLDYRVVASETLFAPLDNWLEQTRIEVIDALETPHGYECVKVRDSVAVEDSSGRRYLRLRVELKANGGTP